MQWWQRFIRSTAPEYRKRQREAAGQAALFLFGGFTLAYMFSEFALSRMLHPLHWATAGLIAALLYAGSYIWMLRRLYLQQAARPAKQASDERR